MEIPGLKYDQYDILKDTISIATFPGSQTAAELAQIYSDVLDIVECHYDRVVFNAKKLKMVDVYEIAGQNALGIASFVGQKSVLGHSRRVFKEGDDWRGTYAKCDLTNSASGAAPEIAEYATWNLTPPAYDYYLTEIESFHFPDDYYQIWKNGTWILDGCDNINDDCDLPNEYHINSSTFADILCVNWREMNSYLISVEGIIEDIEDDTNKKFEYLNMWWGYTPDGEIYHQWIGDASFGEENEVVNHVPLDLEDCDEP